MSDEMPDKVWIDTVELDETNTMRVHGTCPPDSPEPGDIEYLRNPYGDNGMVFKVDPRNKPKSLDNLLLDEIAALESKLAEAEHRHEVEQDKRVRAGNALASALLERNAAEKKLAEAEAVIAKLPRTADGVVVVPGMKLYPLHPIPDLHEPDHGIAEIGLYDPFSSEFHRHGTEDFRTGLCYSTPEAAKEARDAT